MIKDEHALRPAFLDLYHAQSGQPYEGSLTTSRGSLSSRSATNLNPGVGRLPLNGLATAKGKFNESGK
jgi:hypothetical protein